MTKLDEIKALHYKNMAIRVSPEAERSIKSGHPWLFSDSIRKQSRPGSAGDLAVIFDRKGRFLAVGLYDPESPIRVRILHFGQPEEINQDWFAARIESALRLRFSLQAAGTTGYRLAHGENDGLPGLVIDRYADTLVLKLYTTAWMPHLKIFLKALSSKINFQRLVLRFGRLIQNEMKEIYGLEDGEILIGPPLKDNCVIFQENGLFFEADVVHGQKTGFFLDQRDNRIRVQEMVAGKEALNVFAYTGGFSLYAARGGATAVTSLDLSKPALDAAVRNFHLNQENKAVRSCNHELMQGDAFSLLQKLASQGRFFDLVILDPPSFANRKNQIAQGLEAYQRLNVLGLQVLRPNGILVSASCSSRITAKAFFKTVHESAAQSDRALVEIERTYHAIDHPITFSEGGYLKCLFAFAE